MKKYQYTKPKLSGKPDAYVVSVYVDGIQYKKRISKKFTPKEQKQYADALMKKWLLMLDGDLSPFENEDKKTQLKLNKKITLNEAVAEYKSQFIGADNTISNYLHKLKHLINLYGDLELNMITKLDIENVIKSKIKDNTYSQTTVVQAKKTYSVFFRWCVKAGHLKTNIADDMENFKSQKDVEDRHVPFAENHFIKILEELKKPENTLFFNFINFIYTIHLRPDEVRNLKKGDIDLEKNIITVKASIAKNSKKAILPIFTSLRKIIDGMNLNELNDDDYIFALPFLNGKRNIISRGYMSDNFRKKILIPLELYEKTGYTLYSFKAKGNLDKLDKHGWSLPQLQRCNRHSNIAQTLTYLKNIGKITEIDDLSITDL